MIYALGQYTYGIAYYPASKYPLDEYISNMMESLLIIGIMTVVYALAAVPLLFSLHRRGDATRKTYHRFAIMALSVSPLR